MTAIRKLPAAWAILAALALAGPAGGDKQGSVLRWVSARASGDVVTLGKTRRRRKDLASSADGSGTGNVPGEETP